MMTKRDMDILNRAHDEALRKMNAAAVAIAEDIADGETPSKEMVSEYKWSRLGVESTRRDLEYAISLELAYIMDP